MNWNSGFVESINKRLTKERQDAPMMAEMNDGLLMLTSKSLYGEKVHYALELIQNAEDEKSSSITFIFEPDKVIVVNDGEVFTPVDVDAICSVKTGRKKNKIGFFGIGFKSVFNVTDKPHVISSDFNFQITNYIYPTPLDTIPQGAQEFYTRDKGSVFVLPLAAGLPGIDELIESFKELDDKILLFLESIRTLRFIDRVNNEEWSIEKPPSTDSLTILKNGRTKEDTKWRIFVKPLPVSKKEVPIPEGKKGITDTRILIALPADEATREKSKTSCLYCFLPTKQRSDMPFLVQADFVPTVGRANIQEVEWNKWLLKNLGNLSAEALDQAKNDEFLGQDIYAFIPLKEEVQDGPMKIMCAEFYKVLSSKEIAKSRSGQWRLSSDCVIASSPEVPEIIAETDLLLIFGKPLNYVDTEVSSRAESILQDLGSSLVGDSEFIDFLGKETVIKGRDPAWFLKAYAHLPEIFDTKMKYGEFSFFSDAEKKQLFEKLERYKFILTDRNELVALNDPDKPDMLICYPQSMDLSEVNELFTEGEIVFLNRHFQRSTIFKRKTVDEEEEARRETVHDFFEAIGVKVYFKQSHVIKEVILPKYSSGKYKAYDDTKLYKLLNYIRMYWPTLESEVQNKKLSEGIFDEIRRTVVVKCFTKKNNEAVVDYLPPSRVHFSRRYGKGQVMEDLFEGTEGVFFLHPYYLNKENREQKKRKRGRERAEYGWKTFAETLGVWSSPIIVKDDDWAEMWGNSRYDWVERKYSPRNEHQISGDSWSEDIKNLIEYCSTLGDLGAVKERMKILWESLAQNWKRYKDCCSSQYRYYYYSYQHVYLSSSSFLNFMRNSAWVLTNNSAFGKPADVFSYTPRNRLILGDSVDYTIYPSSETFLRDIGINLEPTVEQVVERIKNFRQDGIEGGVRKVEASYEFLAEKTKEAQSDAEILKRVIEEFESSDLLYIPRKDRSWWKPSLVFWRDSSTFFGRHRGYIENREKPIYKPEAKAFMLSVGVSEKPSIEQALQVLDQLRREGDVANLKKIAVRVYSYANDLISNGHVEEVNWESHKFLMKDESFEQPSQSFYEDDEEVAKSFNAKAPFVELTFLSWTRLTAFLNAAKFRSFLGNFTAEKHLGPVSEIEGDQAGSVTKVLTYAVAYVLKKDVLAYETLKERGVPGIIEDIGFYECQQIKLDFHLRKNDSETITLHGIERPVYYSAQENRLYVREGTDLLSIEVAKELSRIFKGAEDQVFPFLTALFPKATDDVGLESSLRLFGIKNQSYVDPEKVEILTAMEEPEKEEKKEEEEQKGQEKKEGKEPKVEPPQPKPKTRMGLINPGELYIASATDLEPHTKTEGEGTIPVRAVELREGQPGYKKPERTPIDRPGTQDAENIAIEIVLNYENGEGRPAEDRHRQKSIGYDVYSKEADGTDRFIEVKHFRGQEGKFNFTPHQMAKARKEGDKYFVYVISGLEEGYTPTKLFVIQNPVKWLTPDPPLEAEYSDWKNAVKKKVDLSSSTG